MAEAYFSTQATVEKKVNSLNITWWLDSDHNGTIDSDAFNAAREEAKQEILAYVEPRYGSTVVEAWDSDTRPEWIGSKSDWMTVYHSLSGNNAEHPVAIRRYEECLEQLEKVRTYQLMVPGIDYVSGQTNETSRMTYLEVTTAEAEAGEADPTSYEYI